MNTEITEVKDECSGFEYMNYLRQQKKLGRISKFKDQLEMRAVDYRETDTPNVGTTTLPDGKEVYFSLVPYSNMIKYRLAGTNNWKEIGKNVFIAMCKGEPVPGRKFNGKFPFGKHKGKTVEEVYETDKQYLTWCMNANFDENIKAKITEVVARYEVEE